MFDTYRSLEIFLFLLFWFLVLQVESITNNIDGVNKFEGIKTKTSELTNEFKEPSVENTLSLKNKRFLSEIKRSQYDYIPPGPEPPYGYIPPLTLGIYRPGGDVQPDYHKHYTPPYEDNYPVIPYTPYQGYKGFTHLFESPYIYKKLLALKGFLIPLAGVALLGAATALTTNPVILQLGTLNRNQKRKRRRRSIH